MTKRRKVTKDSLGFFQPGDIVVIINDEYFGIAACIKESDYNDGNYKTNKVHPLLESELEEVTYP